MEVGSGNTNQSKELSQGLVQATVSFFPSPKSLLWGAVMCFPAAAYEMLVLAVGTNGEQIPLTFLAELLLLPSLFIVSSLFVL